MSTEKLEKVGTGGNIIILHSEVIVEKKYSKRVWR